MTENALCEYCQMTGNHHKSFLIILKAVEKFYQDKDPNNYLEKDGKVYIRLQGLVEYIRNVLGYEISGNGIHHFLANIVEFEIKISHVTNFPAWFVWDEKKMIIRTGLYRALMEGKDD